jgi:hypothetical protein
MATVLEEAALKLAAARSAVMAVALADAEQYRLDRSAWRFCEDQVAGVMFPHHGRPRNHSRYHERGAFK